jgi:hypothetical protein
MLCKDCLIDKEVTAFYASNKSRCKECVKAAVRVNREEKLEYYRSYDRARASQPERVASRKEYSQTPEGRLAHARANGKWQVANAIRKRASNLVAHAVRTGKLVPEPCFVCGEKAQAHHPDYSKPLSVTWLCPEHHKAAHRIVAEHRYAAGEVPTLHF